MVGGEHEHGLGGGGRQTLIVLLLVGALVLLHRFAVPTEGLDPTGMLALGFVILASYTIGKLADVVKLPHIPGYLLAGVLFGPSVASLIPVEVWPPFDRGVLNEDVIGQLSVLDTLAIALIAMTAGGELRLESLRSGLGAITGVLTGQLLLLAVTMPAFVWALSGAFPSVALPGIGDLPLGAVLALGFVVATITFAPSPASTIAVINDVGAEGPYSRLVLSTVVLKDVVVVIAFSLASTWAAAALGMTASAQPLGVYVIEHVGGSLLLGAVVGLLFALYLRYVNQQVLLVIVGVVYATTFVAHELHLDPPMLVFIAAGFAVSNFSRHGEALIHNVERLSMPVYVVFFTLAGAKLHLDQVIQVAPYALALVGLRMVALKLGTGMGARIAGAPPAVGKHGWLGFVSQAGLALSLAAIAGRELGAAGGTIETLVVASIALNELVGPILLKVGIGLAGETPSEQREGDAAAEPEQHAQLEEWPEPIAVPDAWGRPLSTMSDELNREIRGLQADLQAVVRDVQRGPLERFRAEAAAYVRDLRREFLRHHRRLLVGGRALDPQRRSAPPPARAETGGAHDTGAVASRETAPSAGVATLLHVEESQLAEHWRGTVLGRAARVAQRSWSPEQLVESLDRVVQALPEVVSAPYEPETFLRPERQSVLVALRRTGLRFRRRFRMATGRAMSDRRVELRQLARYHLAGEAPARLEALAALLVQGDTHLAARTRSLFDAIVQGYDRIAASSARTREELEDELRAMRLEVEVELSLAAQEIDRIAQEGTARTERVLGEALQRVKEEVGIAGTLDLPNRRRRSSRVFRARVRALDTLGEHLGKLRRSVAAGYSLVALELELVGLEARVKDALQQHVTSLESDVRGRSIVQAERVVAALAETHAHMRVELFADHTGDEMAAALRRHTDETDRVVGEAARSAIQLRDQLGDEQVIAPLLDALQRASAGLTDRYEVPSAIMARGEWQLPDPVPVVEVPFREIVSAHVEANVAPDLLAVTRRIAAKVAPYSASLVELERLVAFNVELAVSELELVQDEEVPDDTRRVLDEMLLGAFDRNAEVIRAHVDSAVTWPVELRESMYAAVLGGVEKLRGQLVAGELSQLRLEVLRRRAAGQRLIRRAGRIGVVLASTQRVAARTISRLLGEERIDAWRHTLGLPPSHEIELPGRVAFAPPRPGSHLPLVYRRLFASETIEAGDVLTGRALDIDRATRALGGEAPGTLRSVALVGQDGVGKGALSAAIVRSRSWKSVHRIVLEAPATTVEVESWLANRVEGHLFVVSGFHWLVGMCPGGFDPLRRFVEGVIADAGKNAWLVHADTLVWDYATQVAPLSDAFPEVIELPVLTPNELEAAVLARHGLSGFGLSFDVLGSSSPIDTLFARGAGRIRRPYEGYFRDLHRASGGLVRDALRLWLASVQEVNEKQDYVLVGPVPPSPQRAIRRLPDDALLSLCQIARQGWMNARVQAHLFRVDGGTAEAQLSRLSHLGLLQRHPSDTYRIQTHLRGPLVRVLREQGWVR